MKPLANNKSVSKEFNLFRPRSWLLKTKEMSGTILDYAYKSLGRNTLRFFLGKVLCITNLDPLLL